MLFEGGSHLKFDTLRSTLRNCVSLSITTFLLTSFISIIFLYFVLDKNLLACLYISTVIGSISPAVVVPIMRGLEISDLTKSTVVVESAISDVLSIVISLSILKAFQTGGTTIGHFIGTDLIGTFAMSLILGFTGAIIWSIILEKSENFPIQFLHHWHLYSLFMVYQKFWDTMAQ